MDPLAQLKDIHLPAPVSLWPLSLYWWLAIALLLVSIILLIYGVYKYQKRNQITRLALAELKQLQQQGCDINTLNLLLKRVVLSSFPRNQVASLHGENWLKFLDQQASTNKHPFTEFSDAPEIWTHDLYSAQPAVATPVHFQTCQNWLKKTPLIPVEQH